MRAVRRFSLSLLASTALAAALAAPASAEFGFETFSFKYLDPYTKEPTTQAGVHADLVSAFTTKSTISPEGSLVTDGQPKNIQTELPAGFYGNPEAIPFCTSAFLIGHGGLCNPAAQVGLLSIAVDNPPSFYLDLPVYNMAATDDETAVLAGNVFGALVKVILSVRTDGDYGLRADIHGINQGLPLYGVKLTLWGVPADPVNDPNRLAGLFQGGLSAGIDPKPFLSMPTTCGPTVTQLRADSWQDPGNFIFEEEPLTITGCDSIAFEPKVKARPTTNAADSPSGIDLDIEIPQSEDPEGLSSAHLRKSVVTLPEGLTLNPSGANGLGSCTPQQIGMTTPPGAKVPHFTKAPNDCPDSSRIAEVEVDTPIFANPLRGSAFVAAPYDNPFNSLVAIYIAIEGRGIVAKLPGEVMLDPNTGRITTVFDENPQLTFEHLRLSFFGGALAPFQTPTGCGLFASVAELTPWSAPESGPPVTSVDRYRITQGPHGQACAAGEEGLPHAPEFEAGSTAPLAGTYRPFVINLRREDGSQRFSSVTVAPPEGLVAKLAGTAICPDSALANAEAKSGAEEQSSPSCPAASGIGTVHTAAGAGPAPYNVPGTAYLSGPYKGAPMSLAIVTPAVAGPFDLGTIVVRTALHLNPGTAQLRAISDPLPTILDGIPLDVRSLSIRIDKPNFTLNPSSCDPSFVFGSLASTKGSVADLLSTFQLGECGQLKFKPRIRLALKGSTKRRGHPALTSILRPRPGDANIDYAAVTLPPTELLDQDHIGEVCTRAQFAVDQCPAASVYGKVSVTSPLVDYPLTGNVYLRASNNRLPDLITDLRGPASQPIRIEAAGKIDTVRGGLRTTFTFIPDVPFTKLVLRLDGRKKGLLVNSREHLRHGEPSGSQVRRPQRRGLHGAAGAGDEVRQEEGEEEEVNRAALALLALACLLLPASAGAALPDNRGWEMVSPADKNGGSITAAGTVAGGGVLQASADGNSVTYSSAASFGPGAQSAPAGSQYLSTRTPEAWTTQNLTVPIVSGSFGPDPSGVPYQLFSTDLTRGLLLNGLHCRSDEGSCPVPNPPLAGTDAPTGYQNYYVREDSGFEALLGDADVAGLAYGPEEFDLAFAGSSPDLEHIVVSTCAALTAERRRSAARRILRSGQTEPLRVVLRDGPQPRQLGAGGRARRPGHRRLQRRQPRLLGEPEQCEPLPAPGRDQQTGRRRRRGRGDLPDGDPERIRGLLPQGRPPLALRRRRRQRRGHHSGRRSPGDDGRLRGWALRLLRQRRRRLPLEGRHHRRRCRTPGSVRPEQLPAGDRHVAGQRRGDRARLRLARAAHRLQQQQQQNQPARGGGLPLRSARRPVALRLLPAKRAATRRLLLDSGLVRQRTASRRDERLQAARPLGRWQPRLLRLRRPARRRRHQPRVRRLPVGGSRCGRLRQSRRMRRAALQRPLRGRGHLRRCLRQRRRCLLRHRRLPGQRRSRLLRPLRREGRRRVPRTA